LWPPLTFNAYLPLLQYTTLDSLTIRNLPSRHTSWEPPLVIRLKSLKTTLCVHPTPSKFLTLKSNLYAIHAFLNNYVWDAFFITSQLQVLNFSLIWHRLQRPVSCFFLRRSLSFRFTFPNLNLEILELPSFYLGQQIWYLCLLRANTLIMLTFRVINSDIQ